MTMLSVNLNKIALLRNSRGNDFPNLIEMAKKTIALGVKGITIHPRPDERHITKTDAFDLSQLLLDYPGVELNIEGFPSPAFIQLIARCKPHQVTLVPDANDQLTSDHGWKVSEYKEFLKIMLPSLKASAGRVALFMDPNLEEIQAIEGLGVDRIELYTEAYAQSFGQETMEASLESYKKAKDAAQSIGLAINAGHDLNLQNLAEFLKIGDIDEVSIGHALTVESIEHGWTETIKRYLEICAASKKA